MEYPLSSIATTPLRVATNAAGCAFFHIPPPPSPSINSSCSPMHDSARCLSHPSFSFPLRVLCLFVRSLGEQFQHPGPGNGELEDVPLRAEGAAQEGRQMAQGERGKRSVEQSWRCVPGRLEHLAIPAFMTWQQCELWRTLCVLCFFTVHIDVQRAAYRPQSCEHSGDLSSFTTRMHSKLSV